MTSNNQSDGFWSIALSNRSQTGGGMDDKSESEYIIEEANISDVLAESQVGKGSSLYQVDIPPYGLIELNLTPLSLDDTDIYPVGAQAWYGSALLAAAIKQQLYRGCNDSIIQVHIKRCFERFGTRSVNVLELGSGAVGLAGIIAGLSITGYLQMQQNEQKTCNTTLTDFEPIVLQQLEYNVSKSSTSIKEEYPHINAPHFTVRKLDWDDAEDVNNIYDVCTSQEGFHLVIGSELVYNIATAHACSKIVLNLLNNNPGMLLVLVQIADREGWDDIFVPTIDHAPNTHIYIESPIRSNATIIHNIASKLVIPGGTLNPLCDFSICYIWR